MKVITLCGLAGSGKTTAADILVAKYDAHEVMIAGKLKLACSQVFRLYSSQLEDAVEKLTPFKSPITLNSIQLHDLIDYFGIGGDNESIIEEFKGREIETPRKLMQVIGTDFLRRVGGDDIHLRTVDMNPSKVNVIIDVRFENELNYFLDNFPTECTSLYIQRDSTDTTLDTHISEKGMLLLKDRCITINNNGTMTQLRNKLLNEVK